MGTEDRTYGDFLHSCGSECDPEPRSDYTVRVVNKNSIFHLDLGYQISFAAPPDEVDWSSDIENTPGPGDKDVSIRVSWSPPASNNYAISGYVVGWATSLDGSYSTRALSSRLTSYTISVPKTKTQPFVYVVAQNRLGSSRSVSARIPGSLATVPGGVESLLVATHGSTSVRLVWSEPTDVGFKGASLVVLR